MSGHLFISYSHQDHGLMDALGRALRREGFAIWLDRSGLDVGDQWRGEIVSAIKSADAFILLLSPGAVKSDEIRKELSLAEDFKKPIFPLLLDGTAISDALAYQLAGLQYIKLGEGKDDSQFQPLVRGLKSAGIKSALPGQARDAGAPFFGRGRQLAQLDAYFRATLAENRAGIGFVVGDSGSGKTALANQFLQRCLDNEPDAVAAIGCCNASTGMSAPYLPFRQILSAICGEARESEASAAFNSQNAARLAAGQAAAVELLLAQAENLVGPMIPGSEILRTLAGTAGPLRERLERADANQGVLEQSRIQAQYTRFLRHLAQQRPCLLVVRDIQWIDVPSMQLLFHLFRELGKSRVLLLASYRPAEIAEGRDGQPHPAEPVLQDIKRYAGDVWIDLDRIDESEALAFVDALIDAEPNRLGPEFRRALVAHTRGNALFCIELLQSMREHGELVRDPESGWKTAVKVDWNRLPARVEAVVQRRIGSLSPDELQALEMASIEGQTFTAEFVARIAEQADRALIKVLSQLAKRHGMVEAAKVERHGQRWLSRYKFLQSHIQKYLYSNLPPREKMFFHGEAGHFLEEAYEGRTDELALQLAWHFDQAGETAKAIDYTTLAARQALRLSGYDEAGHLVQRGLELLEGLRPGAERDAPELALRLLQGNVVKALEGWASAELKAVYDRAVRLAAALGRDADAAPALFGLWAYHLVRLELGEARRIARECEALAAAVGDADLLIQACFSLGNTAFWLGEFAEAEASVRRALELFDPARADQHLQRHGQDSRVFALMFLSIIGSIRGGTDTESTIERMLGLARSLNHPFSLAIALQGAAWAAQNLGRLDWVGQYAQELVDLTRKHRFRFYLGVGQLFHGYAVAMGGDRPGGLAELREGWEQVSAGGSQILHSLRCALLGQVYLADGDVMAGMAIVEEGLDIVEKCGERAYAAELHRVNGELLARGPRTFAAAAKQELGNAAAIAQSQGALRFLQNIQQTQAGLPLRT